jgi:hypothetical protein
VLGTIDIVLVTENAEGHAGAGDDGQLDGSGETLVTLGIIVLEADLELDGLEEVPPAMILAMLRRRAARRSSLLGLVGVLEEFLDVLTNAGDRDFRHDDTSPKGCCLLWWLWRCGLKNEREAATVILWGRKFARQR